MYSTSREVMRSNTTQTHVFIKIFVKFIYFRRLLMLSLPSESLSGLERGSVYGGAHPGGGWSGGAGPGLPHQSQRALQQTQRESLQQMPLHQALDTPQRRVQFTPVSFLYG